MTRIARALLALVVLTVSTAYAQSAKNVVQVGDIAILNNADLDWTTVLSANLKTSSQKDLVIGVSLEAGLYTQTEVKSARNTDTSKAEASIQVQVLIDGRPAAPGEVVFARRTQTLTATFGGIMEECTDANLDGTVTYEECTWTPEELNLVLDTMNANAFFFVLDDVGVGPHAIEVQAKIASVTEAQEGSASAWATIGNGALTVEEVRLVKGLDISL